MTETLTAPQIYFPVLVQIGIAFAVAAGLIGASSALGKRARSPLKDTPYESGMKPTGSARERFSVKFYMVGMIFILFDIEAVFLYPWAVVFRELKMFGFFEMLVFVALVLVGGHVADHHDRRVVAVVACVFEVVVEAV